MICSWEFSLFYNEIDSLFIISMIVIIMYIFFLYFSIKTKQLYWMNTVKYETYAKIITLHFIHTSKHYS